MRFPARRRRSQQGERRETGSPVSRSVKFGRLKLWARVADLCGKAWNLPNTVLGLVYGGCGHVVGLMIGSGPYVAVEANAIQFRNNPFGGVGAITLGNTTTYAGDPCDPCGAWAGYHSRCGTPVTEHERQHTLQGQQLGFLYIPSNLAGGLLAVVRDGHWHGPSNWNERGPMQPVPRPWARRPR